MEGNVHYKNKYYGARGIIDRRGEKRNKPGKFIFPRGLPLKFRPSINGTPNGNRSHNWRTTIIGRRSSAIFRLAPDTRQLSADDEIDLKIWFLLICRFGFLGWSGRNLLIDDKLKCLPTENETEKSIKHSPDEDAMLWCGDMKELSFAPWYGDMNKSLWYLYEASVACGCVAAARPAKSNLYA